MYSLASYGSMIADRVRVGAYAQALRKTIRDGSILLEIGTGPGIFAVLACQLGAGQVYAIEQNEIIQVAREVAAANGCRDKIQFFEESSTQVSLPVHADIILSDLRGVLPLFERHIPAIVDARRRFLAPGGIFIPRKDTLRAAIVEVPKFYSELVDPWNHNPFEQNLSPARRLVVDNFQRLRVNPEQVLTEHRLWTTLDYYCIENHDARGRLDWTVARAGTGHGILVWFDTELAEGIGFSNAPGEPETIYSSLFFPWTHPVSLALGQTVSVDLDAKLVAEDYLWRWITRIEPLRGSLDPRIEFVQSQLNGAVLSPARLRRTAVDYIPRLSKEGYLRRRTLEMIDGKATLEEIARRLTMEFPERFFKWEQALSYASTISQDYSA